MNNACWSVSCRGLFVDIICLEWNTSIDMNHLITCIVKSKLNFFWLVVLTAVVFSSINCKNGLTYKIKDEYDLIIVFQKLRVRFFALCSDVNLLWSKIKGIILHVEIYFKKAFLLFRFYFFLCPHISNVTVWALKCIERRNRSACLVGGIMFYFFNARIGSTIVRITSPPCITSSLSIILLP